MIKQHTHVSYVSTRTAVHSNQLSSHPPSKVKKNFSRKRVLSLLAVGRVFLSIPSTPEKRNNKRQQNLLKIIATSYSSNMIHQRRNHKPLLLQKLLRSARLSYTPKKKTAWHYGMKRTRAFNKNPLCRSTKTPHVCHIMSSTHTTERNPPGKITKNHDNHIPQVGAKNHRIVNPTSYQSIPSQCHII